MKWLVLSFLVLSAPARAQDWIDYELLLRQQGTKVKVSQDDSGHMLRTVTLEDAVTVQCRDGDCIGIDPQGATGCAYSLLLTLSELAAICPAEISPEQGKVLAENFTLMTGYIQKNAVPPRESGYIDGLLRGRREALETLDKAAVCSRLKAPDGDLVPILQHMSSAKMRPVLEQLILHPRLPVINPCL